MTPPWPLVDAWRPNRVGPNTIARFCMDIEFSAESWFILKGDVLKSKHESLDLAMKRRIKVT